MKHFLFSFVLVASTHAWAAPTITAQEAYDNSIYQLFDQADPELLQQIYGNPNEDGQAILEKMKRRPIITDPAQCFPAGFNQVNITVHTAPGSSGGQWLEVESPEGRFGPIPISSAGTIPAPDGHLKSYITPKGCFHNPTPEANAVSTTYGNSPMPHALFFIGHLYAIHGTLEEKHLGKRASHGCVRVSRVNAKALFDLALKYGTQNTNILIVD